MFEIVTSANVPDSTYFRTGDAAPILKSDNTIEILNGSGTRRSSWGAPGVTSTVLVNTAEFVAIHTGFHHKHRGGQFYRYFVVRAGGTVQVRWSALSNEQRQSVLDAAKPYWAKSPGSLK